MQPPDAKDTTQRLVKWSKGDQQALQEWMPRVYDELRPRVLVDHARAWMYRRLTQSQSWRSPDFQIAIAVLQLLSLA